MQLQEREPLLSDPQENLLNGLSVEAELAPQPEGGSIVVRSVVVVRNSGSTPVSFQKPDDTIQFAFTDADGFPVAVAAPPPASRINRRVGRGGHPNAPVIVTLAPGGMYQSTIILRKVRSAPADRIVALRPGDYLVRIRVPLFAADRTQPPEHSYRLFDSGNVALHLDRR